MILGFLGIFAFSTLTYLGLKSISASQAGMISAGIPIAILMFTPLVLKEHIKFISWIGALVSLPVWTIVFGVLLLHEQITWISLIGGALTIIGAIMASL